MAISYPLALPTASGIANIELRAVNAVASQSSPFTFSRQVYDYGGRMWQADITLPRMRRDTAEEWVAFLLSLKGQYGTFLLGDPAAATPRGSAATNAGTPVVNGASQTGDTLNVDGLPTSTNGYLLAGDYIQLGTGSSSRLYKVLQDVDTSSGGGATITIWPELRSSPADNSAIIVSDTVGLFHLASNETSWSINEATTYGITFGAVEAL